MSRTYELRKRADNQAETRRRIAVAAYELHSTVGPARTTISAIAERAGVERATVYRHFPDEKAIFAACTTHGLDRHPPPDPASWACIPDPEDRLRRALTELYAYFRRNRQLLANVNRDWSAVATLRWSFAKFHAPRIGATVAALVAAWPVSTPRLEAAIGHAIEFATWESLTRLKLSDQDAREMMVGLVRAAATR